MWGGARDAPEVDGRIASGGVAGRFRRGRGRDRWSPRPRQPDRPWRHPAAHQGWSCREQHGYAQGGIAAAIGPDDSPELHLADTLAAGAGLCDRAAVELLVHEGPRVRARARRLGRRRSIGARMASRRWRAKGRTASGACCTRATSRAARSRARCGAGRDGAGAPGAPRGLRDRTHVVDGECRGVRFVCDDGRVGVARRERRAARDRRRRSGVPRNDESGGCDRRWHCDGVAVRRAGERSRVRAVPSDRAERAGLAAVSPERGAARRRRAARERRRRAFMRRYDPAGDLAPRDVVATSMVRNRCGRGRAGVPVARASRRQRVRARFPTIAEVCAGGRTRPRDGSRCRSARRRTTCAAASTRISMGGRRSRDCSRPARSRARASTGRTAWRAIAARGTRVRGARGRRHAETGRVGGACDGPVGRASDATAPDASRASASDPGHVPAVMWEGAGLVRDAEGLRRTMATVGEVSRELEAAAIARPRPRESAGSRHRWRSSAGSSRERRSAREESRGGHRRADFPERDDLHWQVHVADRRAVQGHR